jgi:hypothetical protein
MAQPEAPGYYGAYGAPDGSPPPEPPKRSLGLILGVAGAVLVLICCAALVLGAVWFTNRPDNSATAAPSASASATASSVPSTESTAPTSGRGVINHVIRQGDLEITVTAKPQCGVKAIGKGALASESQKGQYCLIDLKFHNVGSRAVKPSNSDTTLIDNEGGETYVDFNSNEANPDEKLALFDNIYPGKTVTGIVAFDLPADKTPATLKLNPVGEFTDEIDIDLS